MDHKQKEQQPFVHYVLSEDDAKAINARRDDASKRASDQVLGQQWHKGNHATAGDHVPAVIVKVWSPSGTVNLKCLLDGNDDYWATSIQPGQDPRTWHWIEKA